MGNIIVVDGANVAYAEESRDGEPKVSNLVAMNRELEERGYRPIIIIDASLRHSVDDPEQLEALIDAQRIRQAPAATDADYFVLQTAQQEDAWVVSNDAFRQRRDEFPWVKDRRVPYMIVRGEVQLFEDRLPEV